MKKQRVDLSTAARIVIGEAGRRGPGPLLLALDGRCGGGKTTLAEELREKLGAAVVHMDDFFLQPHQRTPERLAEPGGNVDRERVLKEVLFPLKERRPAVYRPYDAHGAGMREPVRLKVSPFTIVEGSYSLHPALWDYYDLRIFLDVEPEEQLRRLEARNPERLAAFKSRWIPLEELYFSTFSPEAGCDFVFELL